MSNFIQSRHSHLPWSLPHLLPFTVQSLSVMQGPPMRVLLEEDVTMASSESTWRRREALSALLP